MTVAPLHAASLGQRLDAAFASAAAAAGGTLERSFSLPGTTVRLEFAGPALVPALTGALEHLPAGSPTDPTLTVRLWDQQSTGVALPPIPWIAPNGAPASRPASPDGSIRAAHQPGEGTASVLDPGGPTAYFFTPGPAALTTSDRGTPLRCILHWWMAPRGWQLVHGGAVGTAAGGVLLVGAGGAGKSTSALACIGSELGFTGDDNVLVRTTGNPIVHSMYGSAKIAFEETARFPDLFAEVADAAVPGDTKAVTLVHRVRPADVVLEFPLRAILLPRVRGRGPTRLEPASRAEALAALAPSTILSLPGAGAETFSSLGRLASLVPSYRLVLGAERGDIPATIAGLLSSRTLE
jgi:hypothetical protein